MPDPSKEILKAAKAGDLRSLKALFAKDRDLLHARDKDESTLLHCAAWKGHVDIVAFLLAAGADANATNINEHWGTTPLHAAAHANQDAIIKLLLEHGARLNAKDAAGRTPLDHTTFHNAKAAAKVLNERAPS